MLHVFVYPQNMVGPGEVDEELEGETIEECSKYGKITKCTIFEVMTAQEKLVSKNTILLSSRFSSRNCGMIACIC